jgi:hypothetical protein
MEQPTLFAGVDTPKKPRKHASGPHQEAVDGWTRLWQETRGIHWAWTQKELKFVKDGVKLAGSPQAWLARARALLVDPPDAWHAQNASPSILLSRWNQLSTRIRVCTRDERNLLSLRAAQGAL